MNTKTKVLLAINGAVLAAASNPTVQQTAASFVVHHPWLAALGVTLSAVAHLFVDPKKATD